jgi:hypothetical protein
MTGLPMVVTIVPATVLTCSETTRTAEVRATAVTAGIARRMLGWRYAPRGALRTIS